MDNDGKNFKSDKPFKPASSGSYKAKQGDGRKSSSASPRGNSGAKKSTGGNFKKPNAGNSSSFKQGGYAQKSSTRAAKGGYSNSQAAKTTKVVDSKPAQTDSKPTQPKTRSKVFAQPAGQPTGGVLRDAPDVYKGVTIMYEDNCILVAVKPAGMPSQSDGSGDLDIITTLKAYLKIKYDKPGDVFLGAAHRLDRPVGGIMVFSKNSKSAKRLEATFENHEIEKRYFAIVEGVPAARSGKLINYLKEYPDKNVVRVAPELEADSKYAELDYKVLATAKLRTGEDVSLVQINLVTGKKHQIRVQFAAMGNPLVGDRKYGDKLTDFGDAPCLFAVQITFEHPVTHRTMTFRAYPPEKYPWNLFDMERYLKVSLKVNGYYGESSYTDTLATLLNADFKDGKTE